MTPDGDVEAAAGGGGEQLRRAIDESDGAGAGASAAVLPGEHGDEAQATHRQLGALEAPRRERDDVALVFEPAHDGREEEDVRRVGDVDPDPHAVLIRRER